MIVTTSHATIVNNEIHEVPANTLVENLRLMKKPFVFLRHSMEGNFKSRAYIYNEEGDVLCEDIIPLSIRISFLRYILEILFSIVYLVRKYGAKKKIKVYFGVDPLNTVTGIILKKTGVVDKVVFYSSDYTETRFNNKIINFLYQKIDSFCTSNSDEVWSVSTRIVDLRSKMGLDDKKNIFVPNVPSDEYKKYLDNKKDKMCLVTLGILGKQLDFYGIFKALKTLKIDYPDIKFKIIGSGPEEDNYKKIVKEYDLENIVIFKGQKNHEQALNEISTSGIGLALYNGSWSFNYYGDSMKCREYFCFGLPVLTTDTHSTVDDIKEYNAGIVTEMTPDDYRKSIIKLLLNYNQYSENSYKISRMYDGVHEKNIKRLLSEIKK